MRESNNVNLELAKGTNREYIVKDKNGITIGRIFINELDKKNKYCSFKLNFYKEGEKNNIYLKDTINLMLITLFRNMSIIKVNVIVNETVSLQPFIDLGFKLEGIIENSIKYNDERLSKLIFGINSSIFENNYTQTPLTLYGKDIQLKILTPENSKEVLFYYINNREYLTPFEPSREDEFYTLESQRKGLIESYKNYLNGIEVNFGIYKDSKFIGKIRISNIVHGVFKNGFIGYSIDKNMQNKGYMKQAVNLIIKYAFEEMGIHRLEASALSDNIKSQRVLKACGFKELGINEKYLFIDGRWRDHSTFYKVKEN